MSQGKQSYEAWHTELSEFYKDRRWWYFAYAFKRWYVSANDEQQLKLLRSLSCEFMDRHAIKAVAKLGGIL